VRQVAAEMDVTLVDLQASTWQSLRDIGPGPSTSLYLHVKPGEYAYYKDGKIDNTHLSPKGALWVAGMFVQQLREQDHPLAQYFYEGVPKMPEEMPAIKIWPRTPPVEALLPGQERLEDNRVYNVREPEIIPRPAPAASARGVGVLVFPGGGYHRLAIDKEAVAVADWLNAHGIHAFIVKYRMREFGAPAPLLDAQQALRLVRSRAEEWRLHPNKIGVIGFSAGGHVAVSLLAHFDYWPAQMATGGLSGISARPDFGMLIYPVITMRAPHAHQGSRIALLGENPSEDLLEFYSLETQTRADMPPVFLVHGSNDESVPVQNSLTFYRAAHEAGVPAEMLIYNNAPHGIGLLAGYQQASAWPERALEWLESIRIIKD
jgi:acetyl esterase/lipase